MWHPNKAKPSAPTSMAGKRPAAVRTLDLFASSEPSGAKAKVWSSFQLAVFEDFRIGKGNLCIDACPGGGKSTVLIEALNYLPPDVSDVMMTSFSTQSVEDLKKKNPPWFVDVRTMNSLGNKAITEHFGRQGVNRERVYGILDTVLGERPENPTLRAEFNGFRSRIKGLVDMAKSYLVEDLAGLLALGDMFEMDTTAPGWIAVELVKRFSTPEKTVAQEDVLLEAARRALELCKVIDGNIDFNDQIWLPYVHNLRLETFGLIVVDEAQDTSLAQMDLLIRSCRPETGRIIFAGENAQAIYAWRGAGMGMEPLIKRTNARILPLSVSYRCPRVVVREAAKIVPGIQAAPDAPEGTLSTIAADMLSTQAVVGDTILSRKNAPLIKLFLELLGCGLAVGMQGRQIGEALTKFVRKSEAKTVEELLAYTETWAETEIKRRTDKNSKAKIDHIEDHAHCIRVLCEGRMYTGEVLQRIESLLKMPEGDKILLSSVHRAKGLQWDRVFLLMDTFPVNACYWLKFAKRKNGAQTWAEKRAKACMATEPEERNLLYVAVSRTKKELVYVVPLANSLESA